MARGNLIQGYGRGKLGSTVYSISHGVQVSRVYNPAKFDRKSDSQIIRRAQWVSASQYYSRAIASQFKFAFENKKPNESFQNAFMKRNWNRGILRAFDDVSNPNYPSVGRFIISEGSLRPLVTRLHSSGGFFFAVPTIDDNSIASNTLGYLSRCMVRLGYRQGDIVTFSIIRTSAQSGSNLQPIIAGDTPPEYFFIQFTLDVNSTITMESMNIVVLNGQTFDDTDSQGYAAYVPTSEEVIMGGCVQVSRQLRARLLVSYAEIALNRMGNQAMIYGQSSEWRQAVIDSWKATGNAMLQGDDSENATSSSIVENESTLVFPRTWASMQDKAVVTNVILTNTQFASRIIFYRDADYIYRGIPQDDGTVKYLPKSGDTWTAIARQDSTDPHRWVFESSATSLQIGGMYINNV